MVDRNAKNRVTSDISARLPAANPEDFPALLRVLADSQDDDTVRNEVANLLRRSHCPGLAQALTAVLDNPGEKARFRSFAMQHLGSVAQSLSADSETRRLLIARMQASLNDKDFQVRSQALQNLARLKDIMGRQTAVKWLAEYKPASADNPEFERGTIIKQAIECVHDAGLKECLPAIRKYARDPNIVIARAAIVALSEWRDVESLDAMKEAAASQNALLQRCGKAAVERMARPAP